MSNIQAVAAPPPITATNGFKPGLEGVVAAETQLSQVDGQQGELIIGGYRVEELAPQATFEEVVYLLWHGTLPKQQQLTHFQQELAQLRPLPAGVINLLAAAAHAGQPTMTALRMAAGALDLDGQAQTSQQQAQLILARLPTIVASYWRLHQGLAPLTPEIFTLISPGFWFRLLSG